MVPLRILTPLAVAILTTALALSPAASARPCTGDTITLQVGFDTIYVDDSGHDGGETHLAIYLESNGQGGVQRGGPGALSGHTFPFLFIGFCTDSTNPDSRLYP